MEFRQAVQKDLEQLKLMYREMIRNMNENQIQIWIAIGNPLMLSPDFPPL